MFNLLVAGHFGAWEGRNRMVMSLDRFGEYSGDEFEDISISQPESLKLLEQAQTLLMYEIGVQDPGSEFVRVGQMRDIKVAKGQISFRFTETGQIRYEDLTELAHLLQMEDWEMSRTHWAVKDGSLPQELLRTMKETPKRYDIVLSFAGEDRDYVEPVAEFLNSHGVEVFYDRYEEVTLWGKNLQEHFDSVYRLQARFCVMFISTHYAHNVWTREERRAAFARAMAERDEYVLPVRFDHTEIPGLNPSVGYVDLHAVLPHELGEMILKKLGRR